MITNNIDYFKEEDNFKAIADIKSTLVYGQINDKPPFITILIPTFKRTDCLKQAIDSALNQKNYTNYEVVIVDNDPNRYCLTESLVSSYQDSRIKYYKNNFNLGMMANWNRAFELSNSTWNVLLHDDDVLSPFFLGFIVNYLTDNSIAMLKPNSIKFATDLPSFKEPLPKRMTRVNLIDAAWACAIGAPTNMVFNRDFVAKLGGFNSEYYPTSDYVFSSKCIEKYKCYKLDVDLGGYRVVQNESMKPVTMQLYFVNRFFISCYIMKRLGFNENLIELIQSSLIPVTTKATNNFYGVSYKFDHNEILKLRKVNNFVSYAIKIGYKIFFGFLKQKAKFLAQSTP